MTGGISGGAGPRLATQRGGGMLNSSGPVRGVHGRILSARGLGVTGKAGQRGVKGNGWGVDSDGGSDGDRLDPTGRRGSTSGGSTTGPPGSSSSSTGGPAARSSVPSSFSKLSPAKELDLENQIRQLRSREKRVESREKRVQQELAAEKKGSQARQEKIESLEKTILYLQEKLVAADEKERLSKAQLADKEKIIFSYEEKSRRGILGFMGVGGGPGGRASLGEQQQGIGEWGLAGVNGSGPSGAGATEVTAPAFVQAAAVAQGGAPQGGSMSCAVGVPAYPGAVLSSVPAPQQQQALSGVPSKEVQRALSPSRSEYVLGGTVSSPRRSKNQAESVGRQISMRGQSPMTRAATRAGGPQRNSTFQRRGQPTAAPSVAPREQPREQPREHVNPQQRAAEQVHPGAQSSVYSNSVVPPDALLQGAPHPTMQHHQPPPVVSSVPQSVMMQQPMMQQQPPPAYGFGVVQPQQAQFLAGQFTGLKMPQALQAPAGLTLHGQALGQGQLAPAPVGNTQQTAIPAQYGPSYTSSGEDEAAPSFAGYGRARSPLLRPVTFNPSPRRPGPPAFGFGA